jgi:hypothetical protein
MKFAKWLIERNQRDATKMPKGKSGLELHMRAARKSAHDMQCGRAGVMKDKRDFARGKQSRDSIEKSERGE